jgi:hypothetical protein
MDLARQAAPGTSESFVGAVLAGNGPAPGDAWWGSACSCSVLVSTAGSGVDADHAPVDAAFGVGMGQKGAEDLVPGAVR